MNFVCFCFMQPASKGLEHKINILNGCGDETCKNDDPASRLASLSKGIPNAANEEIDCRLSISKSSPIKRGVSTSTLI